ncbi:TonB-dependent receptor [Thalassotalea sp. HSM 43]|uniref:TonB-dependent receptor n=1 Tax=Thalassotalea sp. HSM 43 TaxID=2552945 RepID=UPI001080E890|nr:TonB-dependent receptor [Thalassotalea sp. HSM 43]QBY05320.1 TonB-dependent receptor [Thalassotalea sp. HSM 43]
MYSNNKLAKAVRLALMFGASATAGISANAFAADEASAEEDVERIEVTGSRIKRTDLEGASPVTVMTAEDIKVEGNFTVADALRGSSFNSFGSFSERSGSSAQSQATINLRGAGSNRTLVLLDGKRLPGSPTLGGQSANLNAIPMAAVERIEILTNGASSTYGSDAMAGVVNIILKKNYEGLEFNIGAGQRDQDEGTTSNEFSVIGGYSTDKGNITFSFDHQRREGIADGDRPYTAAKTNDLNGDGAIDIYTGEADGWSWYGASVFAPDFSEVQASPLCDDLAAEYGSDVFMKMNAQAGTGYPGEVCAFAYANVSYNTASVDRNTLFLDANYEVAEDVEWFGRAMFVQNESFGRYAPPAAPWANISADNPNNPYGVDGAYGLFRWVGIGTRDGIVDDYNQDYLTGLRGELDWNNASWEVYYHRNIADNKSVGRYYLSYGGLAYNEANGIDLGSEEGVANMKATTLQDSSSTFDQYFAGLGFDFLELPGGDIAHYFGAEYMEQTYSDLYDGQSEAGLIGGSAGNSAAGERDITAFFYEAQMPVTDNLELNFAARYDDYSDFGDNTAPMAALRWEPLDGLVVRASYSESFRAPGLDELNAATTFSAEAATDYRQCESQGVAPEDCPERQFDTYYKSNPDLGAEESEYTNLGIAWDITDDMGVKADYFMLSIDNAISTKTVQSLLTDEDQGEITAVLPGTDVSDETFYLIRSPGGGLLEAGTGYFNTEDTLDIEGLDLTFNANFETGFGDFRFNMVNSFVFEWGSDIDYAGTAGAPDHKAVATIAWSMNDFSLAWTTNYTASTSESSRVVDGKLEEDGKLDDWTVHHVTATYDAGNWGALTFQVNNLTDEDPVLNSLGQWTDQNLYNNFGRDYRVSYNIKF